MTVPVISNSASRLKAVLSNVGGEGQIFVLSELSRMQLPKPAVLTAGAIRLDALPYCMRSSLSQFEPETAVTPVYWEAKLTIKQSL